METKPTNGKTEHGAGRTRLLACKVLLTLALLLVSFGSAFAACEEYLGRQFGDDKVLASALSFRVAQASRDVYLRWLGHSSYLIMSKKGVKGLTDPNSAYPLDEEAKVVTISNNHITHNDTSALVGKPVILRGFDGHGRPVRVNKIFDDLEIQNLAITPGLAGLNTVFMYKTGGICIAHLGNLNAPMDSSQARVLDGVEVLLVPIHGWGGGYQWENILRLVAQLKPRLVIPMHYDSPGRAREFVEFVGNRLPVRKMRQTSLMLSKGALPPPTLLLILGWSLDD